MEDKEKLIAYYIAINGKDHMQLNERFKLYIDTKSLQNYQENKISIENVYVDYQVDNVKVTLNIDNNDMFNVQDLLLFIKSQDKKIFMQEISNLYDKKFKGK